MEGFFKNIGANIQYFEDKKRYMPKTILKDPISNEVFQVEPFEGHDCCDCIFHKRCVLVSHIERVKNTPDRTRGIPYIIKDVDLSSVDENKLPLPSCSEWDEFVSTVFVKL